MAPLGVSCHLQIEDQCLIKVDLSAILIPFDSNWCMLCPRAMSFFQKLCPAPFPPVAITLVCDNCMPIHLEDGQFPQSISYSWAFFCFKPLLY